MVDLLTLVFTETHSVKTDFSPSKFESTVPSGTCISCEISTLIMSIEFLIIISANPQDLFSCTVQFLTTSRQYFLFCVPAFPFLFQNLSNYISSREVLFPQARQMLKHCGRDIHHAWSHPICLNALLMFQEFPIALNLFSEGSWIWPGAKPGCVGLDANTIMGLFKKKKQQNYKFKIRLQIKYLFRKK